MTEVSIPEIKKHYVTNGLNQFHYRHSGKGPILILLHSLPRSSEDLNGIVLKLNKYFTVIAPDLPGYGLTRIQNISKYDYNTYTSFLDEFIKCLNIKNVSIYGEQYGASLGLNFAIKNPSKVKSIIINNLKHSSDVQSQYKNFQLSWDGSHLTWLWSFLREQEVFSPWNKPNLKNRLNRDMPTEYELHRLCIQFLNSGEQGVGYEKGIFELNNINITRCINALNCPLLILSEALDNDIQELKIEQTNENISIKEYKKNDYSKDIINFFKEHHAYHENFNPPETKLIPGRLTHDYIEVNGGQLHFHKNEDVKSIPTLIQHDAASAITTVQSITESLIGHKSVFSFDMPGSGNSDRIIPEENVDVFNYAQVLSDALINVGVTEIDFYGMWGGGFVGSEMYLQTKTKVRRLALSNVFDHQGHELNEMIENYTPDVSPLWHGGHLQQCWHQMRDQGTFYPWFKNKKTNIIWREPHLETKMVHGRVCTLLKAGNMYATAYKSHFKYETLEKLSKINVPLLLATCDWDPNNLHTKDLAKNIPNCTLYKLNEDFSKWGLGLLPFFK